MTDYSDTSLADPVSPSASATGDYDAHRRRVLALAGGAGAALLFYGTRHIAHAAILFDTETPETALRVADELFDLSLDFFGRAGRAINLRLGSRQSNVMNLILTQDKEVSDLLKLALRRYQTANGGAVLPNALSLAPARVYMFDPDTFQSATKALGMATTIKDTMVGALHGVLPFFSDDRELLETAASIAGVQGRHAALLREAAGADPFPQAFEPALSLQAVSQRLAPYGYTGGTSQS